MRKEEEKIVTEEKQNRTPLPPLRFCPLLKQAPWGGDRIIPFKKIDLRLPKVGESWEISGVNASESVVEGGILEGMTLNDLVKTYQDRLVGENVYKAHGNTFPLLIKFIDAHDDLSIQVHPDDVLARQLGMASGKTEMWYVVSAAEGATIRNGLTHILNEKEYWKRSERGTFHEVVEQHRVSAGDCFFIPGGRVHSIGRGVFLIEIQQTSDVTYRIDDYGRAGIDGKPRALHLKEAARALRWDDVGKASPIQTVPAEGEMKEIARCDYFTATAYHLTSPHSIALPQGKSFTILIPYEGTCRLQLDQQEPIVMKSGHSVLLPAEAQQVLLTPTPQCRFIEVHI